MFTRKHSYTTITPIPGHVPRQLALDLLHSHEEVIRLNPLVLKVESIQAPRHAAADEYYSPWYEIFQSIQVIPGLGNVGSKELSFKGCFHNMAWGLQTHTYIAMGVELFHKYRISGNQPGEPPEQREMGLAALGAPAEGLYLREDITIQCNFTVLSFVKKQLKAASKEMIQRILKKAELLGTGELQALMEGGKLKTFNPNDRSLYNGLDRRSTGLAPSPGLPSSGLPSPQMHYQHPDGPYRPPMSPQQQYFQASRYSQQAYQPQGFAPVELPADYYETHGGAAELPSEQHKLAPDHRQPGAQGPLSPPLSDARHSRSSMGSTDGKMTQDSRHYAELAGQYQR